MTTKSIDADIIVSGIDKVKVNLANCCNPVYGDEIVGYITKGNGITVHRLHCHNLSMLEERTLDVAWNSNVNKKYETCILIYTDTTDNHMMDLLQTISMFNINVDNIKTISKTDKTVYEVDCYVTGVEQLDKMTLAIKKNTFVEKVERAMR
jgi:GTP pyrophosphokinase